MTTLTRCPDWCVTKKCGGDHFPDLDLEAWSPVRATAWAAHDTPDLQAFPTWGECDDLAPAVGLSITDKRGELSIDLTPTEATQLAHRLLRAADAVDGNAALRESRS